MTITHLSDKIALNNGVEMPGFGLGVWKTKDGTEVEHAIQYALQAGYRHIDTAALYGNEMGVGNAIQSSGIHRDDLFVTTKVWNSNQGFDATLLAFEESMTKLRLETVDLYLIHWPVKGKYKETWRALERLYKDGRIRAIGVSNFQIHHLNDLLSDSEVVPAVNQVEYHPLLTQTDLHEYCKQQGIQLEAWSPLMQGNLDIPVLKRLAEKYNKTVAQIVLRWDIQMGVITIPKSIHQNRIVENSNVFDFELSTEDMKSVSALNTNHRFGADPDNFNF